MTLSPLAVIVPVLAATLLAATSPFRERRDGVTGVLAALGALVLCCLVLGQATSRLVVWFGGWQPRAGLPVGIAFAPDRLGSGMAVFVAGLTVVALIQAAAVIRDEDLHFDAVVLVFLAAMIGFCLTADLFNLFVFFELMSVSAYVLVGYQVRQRSPLEGSLTFAVTNTIGSILLLFGIGLVYGRTGALNLAQIGRALEGGPRDGSVIVAFTLIATGLLVKAAVVPFHFWTADAYAVAPSPVCLLLAGAFAEIGLFGLTRVFWTAFHEVLAPHAGAVGAVLVGAGALTAVLGAIMCAAQHHLKRLLAFATIAQVGLFLIGVGLLEPDALAGTAIWVVADGLVKAALFACVAVVQHRTDALDATRLHGAGRDMRGVGAMVMVGALLIASVPLTGSFLGRAVVEDAALKASGYDWVPALMTVVGAVLGGTLLRMAARVFWGVGEPPDTRADPGTEGPPDEDAAAEADPGSPLVLWLPAAVLLAASVAWGLLPGLRASVGTGAHLFTDSHGYAANLLDGRPPVVLGPEAPPPASTASYLYATATVAGAVAFAAVALAGRRLPAGAMGALRRLRELHSGRPGDYVTWTAAGAAVLGGLFTLVLR